MMAFWKDKQGKELSFHEFMERWKIGMSGITPLQQVSVQLKSTYISIIGILCGIVISIIAIKRIWWLLIILIGALINTIIIALGLWQKKRLYTQMQKLIERGDDNDRNRIDGKNR